MNPFSEDIKDVLVADDAFGPFAHSDDWSVYIAREPPTTPVKVITVYDTPSPRPNGYMDRRGSRMKKNDRCQIRARGTDYKATRRKLEVAFDLLVQKAPFRVTTANDTVKYHDIIPFTDILFLEQDEKDRYIWVVTVQAARQELP